MTLSLLSHDLRREKKAKKRLIDIHFFSYIGVIVIKEKERERVTE